MALILNIDTSSSVCSVCLASHGQVIAERHEVAENMHATSLATQIKEVMADLDLRLSNIDAVAISSGPGSYTGLRIGTSVAKGICYALNKPLIAVLTLQGLAYSMWLSHPDPDGVYIAMLDARRENIYTAVYDAANRELQETSFATLGVDFPDIMSKYNVKNVYFGGSGADKMKLVCLNIEFGIVIENLICVADNMTNISYQKYKNVMFEDLTHFEPFYLKEFEGRMKSA